MYLRPLARRLLDQHVTMIGAQQNRRLGYCDMVASRDETPCSTQISLEPLGIAALHKGGCSLSIAFTPAHLPPPVPAVIAPRYHAVLTALRLIGRGV